MKRASYLKQKARAELIRDLALAGNNTNQENYLWGYLRGLARKFHGDIYNQSNHELFMSYKYNSKGDFKNEQIGIGYHDGLAEKAI